MLSSTANHLQRNARVVAHVNVDACQPDATGDEERSDFSGFAALWRMQCKTKYTDKQKRQAEHITESYEEKGFPAKDAEGRAWATVNKVDGGGKKSGSGHEAHTGHPAVHKGGQRGGTSSASRSAAERSDSTKKSATTRKRHAGSASS